MTVSTPTTLFWSCTSEVASTADENMMPDSEMSTEHPTSTNSSVLRLVRYSAACCERVRWMRRFFPPSAPDESNMLSSASRLRRCTATSSRLASFTPRWMATYRSSAGSSLARAASTASSRATSGRSPVLRNGRHSTCSTSAANSTSRITASWNVALLRKMSPANTIQNFRVMRIRIQKGAYRGLNW